MKKKVFTIAGLILAVIILAACSPAAEVVEESAAEVESSAAALTFSGAADMTWSAADLAGMAQSEAEYTNKDGETSTFSGVAFSELFFAAGVSDYASVTLIASDDYEAEVSADDLSACATCLVSVQDDGTLRAVMPDMSSKVQVKGLVEISVQ